MTDLFATMIEKIEAHPTYAPAMRTAVEQKRSLALDYHNHGNAESWCVSISAMVKDPTRLLQIGVPDLEELVHIKGIGTSAEQCLPFCRAFGRALSEHYKLEEPPTPFLNGQPVADEAEG